MTQLPKHITYSQQSTLYTDELRCPPSVLLTNNSAETKQHMEVVELFESINWLPLLQTTSNI